MNDELTPSEHADLRARLITGTKRIKPVGKHRAALVSGSVAVALVALIAGGVTVGATLSAPPITGVVTTTPTPTESRAETAVPTPPQPPTPAPVETVVEPAPAVVPFDGDCARAVDSSTLADVLEGEPLPQSEQPNGYLFSTPPVTSLLGGLVCTWNSSDPEQGSAVKISVFPAAVVTTEVLDKWSVLRTEGLGYYFEKHREVGDLVIGATATPLGLAGSDPSEAQVAAVERRVDALIDAVARKAQGERAVPAQRDASWWDLGTCADFTDILAAEIPSPLQVGFPGDSIPLGMVWDTEVGAGAVDWCSWYGGEGPTSSIIVEIYPGPGAGGLSDADVAASGASPASVAGADESWFVEDSNQLGDFTVVAVDGPNRLTMRFAGAGTREAAEQLASAFLARLNG